MLLALWLHDGCCNANGATSMIIFVDDDQAYRSWVTHHRAGFVLDGRRRPKLAHLVLHRAGCCEIVPSASSHRRWTGGGRLKATALAREELVAWAADETEKDVACCERCRPDRDLPMPVPSVKALPKLSRDILDYVLEAALIHMEHEQPPYRLTIGDIAACFGKSPARIAPVVGRLIDEGWLVSIGRQAKEVKLRCHVIAPTMLAVRTLGAFETESDAAIEAELRKLECPASERLVPR